MYISIPREEGESRPSSQILPDRAGDWIHTVFNLTKSQAMENSVLDYEPKGTN